MNARICRRDFLNSMLLASGSILMKSLSLLELLSTPFRDCERQVREQFTEMFAPSGFDAKR